MKYEELEYVVKSSKTPIYYTYWIIHRIDDSAVMYYHGVRTEKKPGTDIRDLTKYHSSSKIVKEVYKSNPEKFTKKIDRIYKTAEESRKREDYVHKRLNVEKNPRFYNIKNGAYDRAIPENLVVAKVINSGKLISIKKDTFDVLKKDGIVVGSMKGTGTFIDETGNFIRIPIDEAKTRNLSGVSKNIGIYYNHNTGVTKAINRNEVNVEDGWELYTRVFKQYKHHTITDVSDISPILMMETDPRVISGEYIQFSKDMVTVNVNGKCFNVHKSHPKLLSGEYETAAGKKEHRDISLFYDVNFNKIKAKRSDLINDLNYILGSKLRRKTINGKLVYLNEVSEDIGLVISHDILIINLETNEIRLLPNTDKSLLNFTKFRQYDRKIHGAIKSIYMKNDVIMYSTIMYEPSDTCFVLVENTNKYTNGITAKTTQNTHIHLRSISK